MPYMGFGGALMIGKETTWGTPVARTHSMELISESFSNATQRRPRPTLGNYQAGRLPRKKYTEGIQVGGSFSVMPTYQGFGLLLEALLGTVATTGAGPYTHVFSLVKALPTGLTLAPIRGDGTSEVFAGCLLTKGVIRCEAGKEMVATFDTIGKATAGRVAAGTPSYTTSRDLTIHYSEAGNATYNATNYIPRAIELSVDNKLSRRMLLGSSATARPMPSGPMEISLKLGLEWENDDFHTAWVAGTEATFAVTFTSGAMTFTIELANAYVSSVSDPVSGEGVINQDVVLVPQAGAASEGLKITLVNGQVTALLS